MQVNIRKAVEEDLPDILELYKQLDMDGGKGKMCNPIAGS